MDKGKGEKTKRKRTFSVLGKMLAISGSSGWVGQGSGKVRKNLFIYTKVYIFTMQTNIEYYERQEF